VNPHDKIGPTIERARHATYRKRDVALLIRIMQEAGLSIARVEIGADARISVVHGAPTDAAANAPPERHPWDES